MADRLRISLSGSITRGAVGLLLLLLPAACEYGPGIYGPGGRGYSHLHSGSYDYRAWSDFSTRGPTWWGYLDLRVERDGRIFGSYELPFQCVDAFGVEVTCYGRVGGRIYSDGTLRFGLDEGWLSHDGSVNRYSEATGRWETRLLGYSDRGTFELVPY